jgi:hypothetical protein
MRFVGIVFQDGISAPQERHGLAKRIVSAFLEEMPSAAFRDAPDA